MALAEFWNGVWERNPLSRTHFHAPDVPRTTADELDAALASQQTWRPLRILRGYDEADFDFLPEADRARLTDLVRAFNDIAPELRAVWYRVPTDSAKLAELTDRARESLRDTILLLAQDRYRDSDALKFGKLAERELGDELPDGVAELRFKSGSDRGGDPAIWVWAFLSDEATDDRLIETARRVRPLLRSALRRSVPDRYPFVLFRGVSERVEMEAFA